MNRKTSEVRVTFESQGAKIHGIFYQASGARRLPPVILCHGFPGNDSDVLGLGRLLMKHGFNALSFSYRGSWGSEGFFSAANSLEDVSSAIRYVKTSLTVGEFNVDSSRIALVGHSYGGGMALLGSLSDSSVKKVATIATWNLGEAGRMMKQSPEYRRMMEKSIEQGTSSLNFRVSPKEVAKETIEEIDKYDVVNFADRLSQKDILIIGGWRDLEASLEHHTLPLIRALQKQGARQMRIEMFDTDHSFANVRSKLADTIMSWLIKAP